MPPGLAHELKWNRFVNNKGLPDSNLELDRELEHRNKYVKEELKSYRGKITQKAIDRCSQSYDATQEILQRFDELSFNVPPSGKHTVVDWKKDVKELSSKFDDELIFKQKKGRFHKAFPGFPKSYLNNLDILGMKCWMYEKFDEFANMDIYKEHQYIVLKNIPDYEKFENGRTFKLIDEE